MKGSAGVPILQLETMNKLISKLEMSPMLFFANMFAGVQYPSDAIKWEVEYGSSGLTPFVAPGSVAPKIGLDGVGEGSAKAAYMKEAIFFDEVFLNNIREPGTYETYQRAERNLAKGLRKLRNRVDRRREWMMSHAILNGGFEYTAVGGTKIVVSYGVPDTHTVTLGSTRHWNDGASKNILEDVLEAKRILFDDAGVYPETTMCNSKLLQLLMLDSSIQELLKKSAFGNGDLFTNPAGVIGQLLGVGTLRVFDDFTEDEEYLVGNVTGASTTVIQLADSKDVQVGATARFYDTSENNVWEDAVVESVDIPNATFTIAAVTVKSFKAGEDMVRFRTKTLKDNEFVMMNSKNADGEAIAEDMLAPFGLNRNYGTYVDRNDEFDPEGMILRIQHKSLPVIYHPDCTFKYIVHD